MTRRGGSGFGTPQSLSSRVVAQGHAGPIFDIRPLLHSPSQKVFCGDWRTPLQPTLTMSFPSLKDSNSVIQTFGDLFVEIVGRLDQVIFSQNYIFNNLRRKTLHMLTF